MQMISLTKNI